MISYFIKKLPHLVWFRLTIIISAILIGTSLAVIPSINTTYGLMAIQVSYVTGSGILTTLFMVLIIRGLPPNQQATQQAYVRPFDYALPVFDSYWPMDVLRKLQEMWDRYESFSSGVANTTSFPFSAIEYF